MKSQCPFCAQMYEIDDNLSGQIAECSECKREFEITPCPESTAADSENQEISAPPPPAATPDKTTECGESKNRLVYCLLALFLGGFGVHNFYSGHTKRGIIKLVCTLLFCWTLLAPLAIAIINIIEIFKVKNDIHGTPFRDQTPGAVIAIGVTAIAGVVLCIALPVSFIVLGVASNKQARQRSYDVTCASNVKQMLAFCKDFATGNHGRMPDSLEQLEKDKVFTDLVGTTDIFYCKGGEQNTGYSYLIVPGLSSIHSASMPLIIEKIGHHKNRVQVGRIDGTSQILSGEFARYEDLLPFFEKITSREKEYLTAVFKQWDTKNFSADTVKKAARSKASPYRIQQTFGITLDETYNFQSAPYFISSLGFARYEVSSPAEESSVAVALDTQTHKVLATYLTIQCSSPDAAKATMAEMVKQLSNEYNLSPRNVTENKIAFYDTPAGLPQRSIFIEPDEKRVSITCSVRPIPTPAINPNSREIDGAFGVTLGQTINPKESYKRNTLMKTHELFQPRMNKVQIGTEIPQVISIQATTTPFTSIEEMQKTVRALKDGIEKKYNCKMVLSVWQDSESYYTYQHNGRAIKIEWPTQLHDVKYYELNTITIQYKDEKLQDEDQALYQKSREKSKSNVKDIL